MSVLVLLLLAAIVAGQKIITTRTNPSFKLVTYEAGDIVCSVLNGGAEWEPHYLREIDAIPMTQDRYFLDIGAHIGWLSFYALSKGWHVVAFEPMKRNLEMLNMSVLLNPGFEKRITIYPLGLSDRAADCDITSHNNVGNGNMQCDDKAKAANLKYKRVVRDHVQLVTLDSIRHKLPKFDLIKMDIEGFEPHVFEGGSLFFDENKHVPVLMEFGPFMMRDQGKDPLTFLRSIPYDRVFLYSGGVERRLINIKNAPAVTALLDTYKNDEQQVDLKLTTSYTEGGFINLRPLERRVFSQNGEDGITETLVSLLNITGGYYVEFGTESGVQCNTRILREKYGWKGLLMDGGHANPSINLQKERVTAENINGLLDKYSVPQEFDLISIDIDYNDLHVWKAITRRPKIVIIEYNANHPPGEDKTVIYDPNGAWDFTNYFGGSIQAMYNLGRSKGYSLVYAEHQGVNLFFVRDDLVPYVRVKDINNVAALYQPPRYGGHRKDPRMRPYVAWNAPQRSVPPLPPQQPMPEVLEPEEFETSPGDLEQCMEAAYTQGYPASSCESFRHTRRKHRYHHRQPAL